VYSYGCFIGLRTAASDLAVLFISVGYIYTPQQLLDRATIPHAGGDASQ
jgi:hypothetical protein